jgi:hypothetical protein
MRIASLVRPSLSLALLAACAAPALAAEPAWLGEADCRIAPIVPAPQAKVSWTGACADGYASGKGVLAWQTVEGYKATLEATLVRGAASGDVVLKRPDYTYTGGWVAGRRHGRGEATFATGGSYAGAWKDDRFDGQGKIVYAGSGRVYEGLFAEGRIAGQPDLEAATGRHAVKRRASGSHIVKSPVVSYLPVDASWASLTPAQKNAMRRNYPALDAGDEPPFPARGERILFEHIDRYNTSLGVVEGNLAMHVLVGKDGKPRQVSTDGALNHEMVNALTLLVMLQDFKPGLCQGQPCDMVYPIHFNFTATD